MIKSRWLISKSNISNISEISFSWKLSTLIDLLYQFPNDPPKKVPSEKTKSKYEHGKK